MPLKLSAPNQPDAQQIDETAAKIARQIGINPDFFVNALHSASIAFSPDQGDTLDDFLYTIAQDAKTSARNGQTWLGAAPDSLLKAFGQSSDIKGVLNQFTSAPILIVIYLVLAIMTFFVLKRDVESKSASHLNGMGDLKVIFADTFKAVKSLRIK